MLFFWTTAPCRGFVFHKIQYERPAPNETKRKNFLLAPFLTCFLFRPSLPYSLSLCPLSLIFFSFFTLPTAHPLNSHASRQLRSHSKRPKWRASRWCLLCCLKIPICCCQGLVCECRREVYFARRRLQIEGNCVRIVLIQLF